MSLINCKVELKLEWMNHCALSASGNDNTHADSHNIIFTIKDTKLYVPIVLLLAKDKDKNKTKKYRYFLESNLVRY